MSPAPFDRGMKQAHQAMARRGWTPKQWHSLTRTSRIEILAYEKLEDDERSRLIAEVIEKLPNEFGMLAQALLLNGR